MAYSSYLLWLVDREAFRLIDYQFTRWGREPLGTCAESIIREKKEAFAMRCRLSVLQLKPSLFRLAEKGIGGKNFYAEQV